MKILINSFLMVAFLSVMVSCKNDSGAKATTTAAAAAADATGKTYTVDTAASMIMWEGSKIAGTHAGTMNVKDGSISVEKGAVTGGKFTIDMNSINVTDLEGEKKAYLESHLKGSSDDNADDFFNVAKYPTATFEITKLTALDNDADASHLVYGNLTLKEQTKQIGFRSKIEVTAAGISVSTPKFTIDRTQWGIKYGSDKFFDNLKDKAINDNMSIQIKLMAK